MRNRYFRSLAIFRHDDDDEDDILAAGGGKESTERDFWLMYSRNAFSRKDEQVRVLILGLPNKKMVDIENIN